MSARSTRANVTGRLREPECNAACSLPPIGDFIGEWMKMALHWFHACAFSKHCIRQGRLRRKMLPEGTRMKPMQRHLHPLPDKVTDGRKRTSGIAFRLSQPPSDVGSGAPGTHLHARLVSTSDDS